MNQRLSATLIRYIPIAFAILFLCLALWGSTFAGSHMNLFTPGDMLVVEGVSGILGWVVVAAISFFVARKIDGGYVWARYAGAIIGIAYFFSSTLGMVLGALIVYGVTLGWSDKVYFSGKDERKQYKPVVRADHGGTTCQKCGARYEMDPGLDKAWLCRDCATGWK